MKTARFFLGVVLASCVLVFGAACGDNENTRKCEKMEEPKCEKSGSAVTVCCEGFDCAYSVDGEEFKCAASNCKDAAKKVAEFCAVQ